MQRLASRCAARPSARVDEGARAERGDALLRRQEVDSRGEPEHDLRGGALPEHRRVLGAGHGDLPDPRGHLHARLPLLLRALGPPDGPPDPLEPLRLAQTARTMGLDHVVVTSVDRDDLPDRGAGQYAATIRALKRALPAASVEVLTPDFLGSRSRRSRPCSARGPTSSTTTSRPCGACTRACAAPRRATTGRSRCFVARASSPSYPLLTKSGIIVGLGERNDGGGRDAARPARRRRRRGHDRPVPATEREARADRPLGSPRRVRLDAGARARPSVSAPSSPGRSCARAIAPTSSAPRPPPAPSEPAAGSAQPAAGCGRASARKSSAASRVASSTPASRATSRSERPEAAAALTISVARS